MENSGIVSGVNIMCEYEAPDNGRKYSGYIDYENKISGQKTQSRAYSVYMEFYMDNPDKTTGLFTTDKDILSIEDKERYAKLYDMAQENRSVLWKPVISFDNRWLAMMGVYEPEEQLLNVREVQAAVRTSINRLIKEEHIEGAVWTAAIHHNTDHYHVHVSIVQPCPIKTWDEVQDGKFKLKHIKSARSAIVNYMMDNQPEFDKIRELSRDILLSQAYDSIINDTELRKSLENLLEKLPKDHRMWKYGMNAMKAYRGEIDAITTKYLEGYCKEDYIRLQGWLLKVQDKMQMAYGGSDNNYAENQIRDLYKRIGNTILREGKKYIVGYVGRLDTAMESGNEETLIYDCIEEKNAVDINLSTNTQMNQEIFENGKIDDFKRVAFASTDNGNDLESNVFAEYKLAMVYITEGITEKIPKAIEMLKELAEEGNMDMAQYALGKIYANEESELYDLKMAVVYLEKSAGQGNEYAQYTLGKIYIDRSNEVHDVYKGIYFLKKAYQQGNKYAGISLALEYMRKDSPCYNHAEGYRIMKDAADHGNQFAGDYLKEINRRRMNPSRSTRIMNDVMMALKESCKSEIQDSINDAKHRELEYEIEREHSQNSEYGYGL